MYLFHKKSGPLRPLPAGIPIDGSNYERLRSSILRISPIIEEQQAHITRGTGTFTSLEDRQRVIHIILLRHISPASINASEPWLKELNDVRCAMELRGITLLRLQIEVPSKITTEYLWEHWRGYLENYTYLQYLLNRLLKELADYEHGTWWWTEKELPVLEPPFATAASDAEPERTEDPGKKAEKSDKQDKHVTFEKRVQGWYFNEDEIPLLTGRGEDEKARKQAEFHDRVVDGKSTVEAMILHSHKKKGGYLRCTEGFSQPPARKGQPRQYQLSRLLKPMPLLD